MSELAKNLSEKEIIYTGFQNRVEGIDQKLDADELTADERQTLLDEREGVRLQAVALAMTRLEYNSLPPVNNDLAEIFFRPSNFDELQRRLQDPQENALPDLRTIHSVIERDIGARLMAIRFGGAEQANTWVDTTTGITPRIK